MVRTLAANVARLRVFEKTGGASEP
jgi:hypothetical protein